MEKESKHQKFRRLAEKRTNNIIKNIRILSNCSNRSLYEYTKEEVEKIFNAIQDELKKAKAKFSFNEKPKDQIFKL